VSRRSDWYYRYTLGTLKLGDECCSRDSVAYHYVKPDLQYKLFAYLYIATRTESREA